MGLLVLSRASLGAVDDLGVAGATATHVMHDPQTGDAGAIAEEVCGRGYALLAPGLFQQDSLLEMANALERLDQRGSWDGEALLGGIYDDGGRTDRTNAIMPYVPPFDRGGLEPIVKSMLPQVIRLLFPLAGASLAGVRLAYTNAVVTPINGTDMELHFDTNHPLQLILRIFPEGQVPGQGESTFFAGCMEDADTWELVNAGLLAPCWAPNSTQRRAALGGHARLCRSCVERRPVKRCLERCTTISSLPAGAALLYNGALLHAGLGCAPGGGGRRVWDVAFHVDGGGLVENDDMGDQTVGEVPSLWAKQAELQRRADWDTLTRETGPGAFGPKSEL